MPRSSFLDPATAGITWIYPTATTTPGFVPYVHGIVNDLLVARLGLAGFHEIRGGSI
jgi:hypothetical protein